MWIGESSVEGESSDSEQQDRGGQGFAIPSKPLEILKINSGKLLVIDQFMLGNPQFLSRLSIPKSGEAEDEAAKIAWLDSIAAQLKTSAHDYGGCILQVEKGDWAVFREPMSQLFVLAPVAADAVSRGEEFSFDANLVTESRGNAAPIARVLIDTRCVVFVDAELLSDRAFLEQYCVMRADGDDKGARDLLRKGGAAVRYGFNRDGDELGVFMLDGGRHYAFWPDVVEDVFASGIGKASGAGKDGGEEGNGF